MTRMIYSDGDKSKPIVEVSFLGGRADGAFAWIKPEHLVEGFRVDVPVIVAFGERVLHLQYVYDSSIDRFVPF